MRPMQPYLDIILVIQRHISEYRDDRPHHIGVTPVCIDHKHVEKYVNKV
jgi:hypothetical protein